MSKAPEAYPYTFHKRRMIIRPRGESWQADFGRVNGRRKMRSFKAKVDAENWLRQEVLLFENQGAEAFDLSSPQRMDAIRALGVLKGLRGASLEKAAAFYAKHNDSRLEHKTVAEVAAEYVQDSKEHNLRPRSVQDIEHRLKKFCETFGEKGIDLVMHGDAKAWVSSIPLSPVSRKHYSTVAHGLFSYAMENGYVAENPFQPKVKRSRRRKHLQDERMPECLTRQQVDRLLLAAVAEVPNMVGSVAIGCFAGLRTDEIRRLDWQDVDIEEGLITVKPEVAKKRRARHVTIEPNLAEWLKVGMKAKGPVSPEGRMWRYYFDKVRKAAGIDTADWPNSAMRHTFASHHYRHFNNAERTAVELGHRGTAQLFEAYRALVKPKDAELFWKIHPKADKGVVKFPQTA